MDRYAIFIDAGYFFAAGSNAAFGNTVSRKQVALISPSAMVAELCSKASEIAGDIPLLRAYWYDAMPGPRPSMEQTTLAMLSGVKLRLGALNSAGEQKGVDSLIVTDMIDLARNRAIADAIVVTGDEDLRIAVQVAQSFGVRVHILAAGDPAKNVSSSLQMEADSINSLDRAWFLQHLKQQLAQTATTIPAEVSMTSAAPAMDVGAAVQQVIDKMLAELQPDQAEQLAKHFSSQKTVPPEYDRRIIAQVSSALANRVLTGDEKRSIRGSFIKAVRASVTRFNQ